MKTKTNKMLYLYTKYSQFDNAEHCYYISCKNMHKLLTELSPSEFGEMLYFYELLSGAEFLKVNKKSFIISDAHNKKIRMPIENNYKFYLNSFHGFNFKNLESSVHNLKREITNKKKQRKITNVDKVKANIELQNKKCVTVTCFANDVLLVQLLRKKKIKVLKIEKI